MATSSRSFILPASARVYQSPLSLPSSQIVDCRAHSSQPSSISDRKDLSFVQIPAQSTKHGVLLQHLWRDVATGAMLYNSNVETGSDEAEVNSDHNSSPPLERGIFSEQQVSIQADGNVAWDLQTDPSVGEYSHGNVPPRGLKESSVNASGWIPICDRYRKGNKQFRRAPRMATESDSELDGVQGTFDTSSSIGATENHPTIHTRARENQNLLTEDIQEAKVKEIACCILTIKRIRLACIRAISRTLRNIKDVIKEDSQSADGSLTVDETEPEGRTSEEGRQDTDTGEPSGRSSDEELDEIPWDVLKRLWENPAFVKFRVSVSMANLTMALPTFLSRALPLLSSSPLKGFSFPVLAPLLFGGGIIFKSAVSNLGFVLPRMLMSMAIMWVLWALNHVIQDAIQHLRDNGSFDRRVASVLVLFFELTFSAIAVVTVLSSIGLNVNSLLLPSFLALALAGKDVWQNYFAGFFLFAAQPFRPGHSVAVMCGQGTAGAPLSTDSQVMKSGWFEGVCEAVDLRYTVLRNGRHRLMVPNAIFVKREFLIIEPEPQSPDAESAKKQQSAQATPNHRPNELNNGNEISGPYGLSQNVPDKSIGWQPANGSVTKSSSANHNGVSGPKCTT